MLISKEMSSFNADKTDQMRDRISQTGYQNPLFISDAVDIHSIRIGNDDNDNDIDSRVASQIEANHLTVDLMTSSEQRRKRLSVLTRQQEVDILICNRVYTIRTRTYVNAKKSWQMLKPVLVLIMLLLLLIFLFRVDVFVSSNNRSNPNETV